ncbi:MAG: hypothetical protein HY047_15225 [Acidobacteria bacterium]|nr:hypothetical protein [Acidobacteriota bacterium]
MKEFTARWLNHPRWPVILGVVAIVVTLRSLWTGFVVDDYVPDDGRPTKIGFHFDAALEDDSIAWFARLEPSSNNAVPTRGRYPPWKPPPVGQAISVR